MNGFVIESLGRERRRDLEREIAALAHDVTSYLPAAKMPFRHRLSAFVGEALIGFGCRLTRPSLAQRSRLVQGTW
jgi:hypothetical protein